MEDNEFVDFSDSKPKAKQGTNTMTSFLLAPTGSSLMHFIHLIHRLAVFAVAIVYVEISLHSFSTAMTILHGSVSHDLPIVTYRASLIADYAGTTTIQQSPLVQQVLYGSTSPRNDSLYLETATTQSSTGCSNVPGFNGEVYGNEFLRFIFSRMQIHASHNLSYLTEVELIAPVIDCSFALLAAADPSSARVYYLVRQKDNSSHVALLSTSLSVQDYEVEKQFQSGAALVLAVASIDDLRVSTVDHQLAIAFNYPYVADPAFAYSELKGVDGDNFWLLECLPNPRNHDPVKTVRMARRFGRYISDTAAQSNVEMAHWDLPTDPVAALSSWRWHSRTVLHDSWAWTHAIHGPFALNVIFNLLVLLFVMYRRLCMGQIWVGYAFSTISNMLLYRGMLILVCNQLNGFWTITKMCVSIGDSIADLHAIYYRPELVHADLLSIFMTVVSIMSYLGRERVDPLLAFLTFELGWRNRLELSKMFPALREQIANFAVADASNGLLKVSVGLGRLSPMALMTAYPIVESRRSVVGSAVLSISSPIIFVAAYIILRKAVRYVESPLSEDTDVSHRRSRAYTKGLEEVGDLTSFEVATGAPLSNRFGVVSGYDNYVANQKELTASIDAVYGNGFLVVNGKFLIGAQDLLPLLLMKLTRVRFTNLFVYEITEKSKVNETARLVYPSTITWSDLGHLDVTVLT